MYYFETKQFFINNNIISGILVNKFVGKHLITFFFFVTLKL